MYFSILFKTVKLKPISYSPHSILFTHNHCQLLHQRIDLVLEGDTPRFPYLQGQVWWWRTQHNSCSSYIDPCRCYIISPLILGPADELLPGVPLGSPLNDEAPFMVQIHTLIIIHDSLSVLKV